MKLKLPITSDKKRNSSTGNESFIFYRTIYQVTQNQKDKKLPMVPGFCQRISLWRFGECQGEVIRQICHLSTGDLKEVEKRNTLKRTGEPDCFIANKFDSLIDPSAIVCQARKVHHQEASGALTGTQS